MPYSQTKLPTRNLQLVDVDHRVKNAFFVLYLHSLKELHMLRRVLTTVACVWLAINGGNVAADDIEFNERTTTELSLELKLKINSENVAVMKQFFELLKSTSFPDLLPQPVPTDGSYVSVPVNDVELAEVVGHVDNLESAILSLSDRLTSPD